MEGGRPVGPEFISATQANYREDAVFIYRIVNLDDEFDESPKFSNVSSCEPATLVAIRYSGLGVRGALTNGVCC